MKSHKKNFLMANLNEFIQVYDDVLEPNICEFLIGIFEQFQTGHERIQNDNKQCFTQYNLTENCKIAEQVDQVHNHLIRKTLEYKEKYYELMDARCFPPEHAFEQFRIKKYNPGGEDLFDTHVDVINHETARRYLSFFWYLNDVETGGHTQFLDTSVIPKTGRLVMFPPMWMFPHKGQAPLSGPKYLLHTYLHYK